MPGGFRCDCKIGFTLDPLTNACEDINECQINNHECLETQRCDNTIGSYRCIRTQSCGTGYTFNAETQNCEGKNSICLAIFPAKIFLPFSFLQTMTSARWADTTALIPTSATIRKVRRLTRRFFSTAGVMTGCICFAGDAGEGGGGKGRGGWSVLPSQHISHRITFNISCLEARNRFTTQGGANKFHIHSSYKPKMMIDIAHERPLTVTVIYESKRIFVLENNSQTLQFVSAQSCIWIVSTFPTRFPQEVSVASGRQGQLQQRQQRRLPRRQPDVPSSTHATKRHITKRSPSLDRIRCRLACRALKGTLWVLALVSLWQATSFEIVAQLFRLRVN